VFSLINETFSEEGEVLSHLHQPGEGQP
jgi:hypothetical protein